MYHLSGYLKRVRSIAIHPSNRGHWAELGHWGELARRVIALRSAVIRNVPLEFPYLNGTRIRCWPDTHASRSLAYYRVPDYAPMRFMQAYLRPGDDVLDVGANIGLYTVLAASLTNPSGHVDSIEPIPETARRLRENVELNDFASRVTIHELAVGSDAESVLMTDWREATNCVIASNAQANGIRVRAGRLDEIASRANYAFGKLDIEGREWDALKGAFRLLSARTPPVWIVEINGALFRYGHQVVPFLDWMSDLGFDPWTYDPDLRTLTPSRSAWDDVFFIARDRLPIIESRISGLRTSRDPGG